MRKLVLIIGCILLLSTCARAQGTSNDEAAIRKTALDYIEGWYAGDAARMESALHAELAKRMFLLIRKPGVVNSIILARCSWSRTLVTAAAVRR